MRVLVTGGTGFVGSRLATRLASEGNEVWITGREGEAGLPEGCSLVGWEEASRLVVDACMHQAANNDTLDESMEMMDSNVFAPARLFHALASKGCRRFVYASSTAVYGNRPAPYKETTEPDPLNIYAKSKLIFEEFAMSFAEESDSSVFGLRYCNVYGPGESHKGRRASMVMQIALQMLSGLRPRIFREGEQRRDWVHVEDVVEANMACLSADEGGVFNVAGGRGVSFNRLVGIVNEELGVSLEPEYMDCPFTERYQNDTQCDISKARHVMGWSPRVTVEEGVKSYLTFLGSRL